MPFARLFFSVAFATMLYSPFVHAIPIPKATSGRISLPIEQWLSDGERKTFKWKLNVSHPELTFQQRYRVWVTASVDTESLQARSVQRELHFVLKVADQDGKWFDGETSNTFEVKKQFTVAEDIQFEAGLYLRPGAYKVAVVLYDAILKEHDVAFATVVVTPQGRDLRVDELQGVPTVEFLPIPVEGVAALGTGHAHLPVETKQPVEVDLLVDLASSAPEPKPKPLRPDERDRGFGPYSRNTPSRRSGPIWEPPQLPPGVRDTEKGYQTQLLESASVLADVEPTPGCTRVTVINSLSRKVIMKPQPALAADWEKIWQEVVRADLNVISAGALSGAAHAIGFVHDQLQAVIDQAPVCDSQAARPMRVVTVLSFGANPPQMDSRPALQLSCRCKIVYFEQHQLFPPDVRVEDDLGKMLAPLRPVHMPFSNARQFRDKIADFMKFIAKSDEGS
jgi:hypothetical protein